MTLVTGCHACQYWVRVSDHDGTCRRHAPAATRSADEIAHWATTAAHHRCGEGVPVDAASPNLVSCSQCRFWDNNHGNGLVPRNRRDALQQWWDAAGHCIRRAPAPSSAPGERGFWPATHQDDGCAEAEADRSALNG